MVVQAAPISGLVVRFIEQLACVPDDFQIPEAQIMEELGRMRECYIGKTINRRVVRLRDDYMWRLERSLSERGEPSLEQVSLRLAEIPMKANDFQKSGKVTRALFAERAMAFK